PAGIRWRAASADLSRGDGRRRGPFHRPLPGSRVPRVTVVGSANVDFTVALSRLPRPGETVTGGTLLINHGGKGANQAVAARRLGAEGRFIGCVGDDAAGQAIRDRLAAEGIGGAGPFSTARAAPGPARIGVDPAGRNQMAVAPGANHRVSVEMVAARAEDFGWPDVMLCPLELPPLTVVWALREAKARGAITVFNPAPVQPLSDDVWSHVDYLTPNEG